MGLAVMTGIPAYSQQLNEIAMQPGQAIFETAKDSGILSQSSIIKGGNIPNQPSYLREASDDTGANRTYLYPNGLRTTDFKDGLRRFDYFMSDGTVFSFIVGAPVKNIQGPPAFPILGGEEYYNGDVRNDIFYIAANGFCDVSDFPYS
jgi:hypothetical protein